MPDENPWPPPGVTFDCTTKFGLYTAHLYLVDGAPAAYSTSEDGVDGSPDILHRLWVHPDYRGLGILTHFSNHLWGRTPEHADRKAVVTKDTLASAKVWFVSKGFPMQPGPALPETPESVAYLDRAAAREYDQIIQLWRNK